MKVKEVDLPDSISNLNEILIFNTNGNGYYRIEYPLSILTKLKNKLLLNINEINEIDKYVIVSDFFALQDSMDIEAINV